MKLYLSLFQDDLFKINLLHHKVNFPCYKSSAFAKPMRHYSVLNCMLKHKVTEELCWKDKVKYASLLVHHSLRSSSRLLLSKQIFQKKNKFKNRAFSFVAPKLWNDLPDSVRNAITLTELFKKNLKTHLSQKFYQS